MGCDPFPGRNSVYVFYFQGGSIYTNQYHQITPKVLTNTHVFLETLHYPSRMILDLCRNLLVALFIFHGYGCMGIFQILRWAPTTRFEAPKKFPLSNRIFLFFPSENLTQIFFYVFSHRKWRKKDLIRFFFIGAMTSGCFFFPAALPAAVTSNCAKVQSSAADELSARCKECVTKVPVEVKIPTKA